MCRGLIAIAVAFAICATVSSTQMVSPGPSALAAPASHILALPVQVPFAHVNRGLEMTVLNLLNEERVAAGLAPLMPHSTIQSAARVHGRELFAAGYLTHVSWDGRTPRERLLALGVHVRLVGENLAYAADVRTAHHILMASGAHRRNILFARYQLVGVAVADGGADGVIVVEDFSDEGTTHHLPRWWEGALGRPAVRPRHGN